jgi:hypothetical protein
MLPLQCRAGSSSASLSLRMTRPRLIASSRPCVLQHRYNSNFQQNRPPLYGKEAEKTQASQAEASQQKKAPLSSEYQHCYIHRAMTDFQRSTGPCLEVHTYQMVSYSYRRGCARFGRRPIPETASGQWYQSTAAGPRWCRGRRQGWRSLAGMSLLMGGV